MIHLSFSTVLMTVFMSTLMLAVIAVCFRNEKLMVGIGHKLMAVFCILILARLLLPLELPFTKTFVYPEILSRVMTFFLHPYGTFLGIKLRLWTVFCIVWLVRAIVLWVVYFREHKILRYFVTTYGEDVTNKEPYASMLQELCSEKQCQRIRIKTTLGIGSPMILGLCRPIILLPADVNVSDDDTYFAIKHEICHYVHHDLWIKTVTKCLTVAYWWNPFCRQLNKRIGTLMEMRIDETIMRKNPEEAIRYLTSLHHHAAGMDNGQKDDDHSAALCFRERGSLYQRLQMMHHQGEKRNVLMCIGMLILIMGIYIGSYLVILEPASHGYTSAGYDYSSKGNLYAIENEDGDYDIYTSCGHHLETVDSLEYYQKITVYSSEEEYHEKNQ